MPLLASLVRPFGLRALPGIVISAIPVISFFAMGYKLSCAYTAMEGSFELPKWQDWKRLFVFGLVARIIQVLWFVPAALIFANIYFSLRAVQDLQGFSAITNLFAILVVLMFIAGIFAPASVL